MRGYFAIGIYHPKTEMNVGTLWRSAASFGASFIFTVGRRYKQQHSDTTLAWRHIPLFHFESLDSVLTQLPYSCPLVGIELTPEAKPIEHHSHHERACYLLGAEDHGLPRDVLDKCHESIVLPGKFCHNVAVAGSLVMFDRITKRSQKRAEVLA